MTEVVVSGLIVRNRSVLILRRSLNRPGFPGEWEPVSGKLRRGETPWAGVRREIAEEAGLDARVNSQPINATWCKKGAGYRLMLSFAAHAPSGRVHLSREHVAFRWLDFEQIEESPGAEGVRESLRRLVALWPVLRRKAER